MGLGQIAGGAQQRDAVIGVDEVDRLQQHAHAVDRSCARCGADQRADGALVVRSPRQPAPHRAELLERITEPARRIGEPAREADRDLRVALGFHHAQQVLGQLRGAGLEQLGEAVERSAHRVPRPQGSGGLDRAQRRERIAGHRRHVSPQLEPSLAVEHRAGRLDGGDPLRGCEVGRGREVRGVAPALQPREQLERHREHGHADRVRRSGEPPGRGHRPGRERELESRGVERFGRSDERDATVEPETKPGREIRRAVGQLVAEQRERPGALGSHHDRAHPIDHDAGLGDRLLGARDGGSRRELLRRGLLVGHSAGAAERHDRDIRRAHQLAQRA